MISGEIMRESIMPRYGRTNNRNRNQLCYSKPLHASLHCVFDIVCASVSEGLNVFSLSSGTGASPLSVNSASAGTGGPLKFFLPWMKYQTTLIVANLCEDQYDIAADM